MKILSWNVNGFRACVNKGAFGDFIVSEKPDLLFIQETKMQEDQLDGDKHTFDGYKTYWNSAVRKGYSGVAMFSKKDPDKLDLSLGRSDFDDEGRIIKAQFGDVIYYGIYFPNSGMGPHRLAYKLDFADFLLDDFQKEVKAGNKVVACGDFNVAHEEIDIARPKENENSAGFLKPERDWMTKLLSKGFVDTFRHFYPDAKDKYSWWSPMFKARERNVGWRIDYFIASENIIGEIKSAFILDKVMGSDHCPVGIEVKGKR